MKLQSPEGVFGAGLEYWNNMTGEYEFTVGELDILKRICVLKQIQEVMLNDLDLTRMTIPGVRGTTVAHPLLNEIRQYEMAINSLIKSLKLPISEEKKNERTERMRATANIRWAKRGDAKAS